MNDKQFSEWMKSSNMVQLPNGDYVKAGNQGTGALAFKEEPPLRSGKRKAPDRQGSCVKSGKDHPKFSVSVTFKMSDNRKRDLDGQIATVLDCLIDARRRFVATHTGATH